MFYVSREVKKTWLTSSFDSTQTNVIQSNILLPFKLLSSLHRRSRTLNSITYPIFHQSKMKGVQKRLVSFTLSLPHQPWNMRSWQAASFVYMHAWVSLLHWIQRFRNQSTFRLKILPSQRLVVVAYLVDDSVILHQASSSGDHGRYGWTAWQK